MFHKNGKKGALEEAQKRNGSLLCLFDGQGVLVDHVTGHQM